MRFRKFTESYLEERKMQPQLLEVKRDRFDLLEDQVYLLQGKLAQGNMSRRFFWIKQGLR